IHTSLFFFFFYNKIIPYKSGSNDIYNFLWSNIYIYIYIYYIFIINFLPHVCQLLPHAIPYQKWTFQIYIFIIVNS
ncbi:hypothetical protein ACMBCM_08755, partial [Spiroplasma sp. K1]